MGSQNEREYKLRNRVKQITNRKFEPAILGDENGNVIDTTLPGHVLVRYQTSLGLTPQVISVRGPVSTLIKLDPGTPVQLLRDTKDRLYVGGVDADALIAMQVDPVAYGQRVISQRTPQSAIETMWCFQSSPPSTVVNVKAWAPIINNVIYLFPGGKIDLGPAQANVLPAAGYQAWIVVFVKNDYLTLEARSSTAVLLSDFLDPEEAIQECLNAKSTGSTPSWAILLQDNPGSVNQNTINNGIDLRNMVNSDEGGGVSALNRVIINANGLPVTNANGFFVLRAN